ncbi:DegT/DnrJ/EryC1/StrS family aminotransferase [Desulfobacterales bacterium]|nr:DegT/DnrJ/EryC1/StrS family aminotransferase [Desulfobacterales bacterium]
MWYPPAETKIPLSALLPSFLPLKTNCEQILCNYLNTDKCILGNSGRSLLYLLLRELYNQSDKSRNVILVPGYTCYSVAASVAKAELKIGVYDIDCETLHPNLQSIKSAISSKTLAIIHQHLFGIPTSITEIQEIAADNDVYVIEDAAQALGGKFNGQMLGSMGDFGLYSFGRGKPLPLGGGGALIGRDESVLTKIRSEKGNPGYKQLAITASSQVLTNPIFYGILEVLPLGLGETVFDTNFETGGFTRTFENVMLKSLPTLEDLNKHRNKIASIYFQILDEKCTVTVEKRDGAVYTRFPIIVEKGDIPNNLKKYGVRKMYPEVIPRVKEIKPYLAHPLQSVPGSIKLSEGLVTLPTHSRISPRFAKEIALSLEKSILWK